MNDKSRMAVTAETPSSDPRTDTGEQQSEQQVKKTEHRDDEQLRDKWASIVSAVDGETIDGTVMDVTEVGDEMVVEAETRLGTVTERFDSPKPPLDTYPFTRLVNEYGQGLVDIPALEGEAVPCQYDEDGDEWSIAVPTPSWSTRLQDLSREAVTTEIAYHLCATLGMIVFMPIGIVAWLYQIQESESALVPSWDGDGEDYVFFAIVSVSFLTLWFLIIAGPLAVVLFE